jgi:hypothetical protein
MTSKRIRDHCFDKAARSVWLQEMFASVARGQKVLLCDESQQHLAACEQCAEYFLQSIENVKALRSTRSLVRW